MYDLLKEIKSAVRSECKLKENFMDDCFYNLHLEKVEKYSLELNRFYPADIEILGLAAYLHDISAIRDYKTIGEHNLVSADIAGEIMAGRLAPAGLVILQDAIRKHSFPVKEGTAESIILSNADAMSKFDCPVYWISYAYKRRFGTYNESADWYMSLIGKTYDLMLPEAREIIDRKYILIKEMPLK